MLLENVSILIQLTFFKMQPKFSYLNASGETEACFLLCASCRCLIDAKLTGSRSHFLPRTQDDKLRFELEAFRFAQGDQNEVSVWGGYWKLW